MLLFVKIIILFQIILSANGARILAVIPTLSYSHQIVFQPIWRELSLRGHQVTTVTTDPIKDPALTNLTEIDLHYLYDELKDVKSEFMEEIKQSQWNLFLTSLRFMLNISDRVLQNPEVQHLIEDKKQNFDLVMMEFITPEHLGFAERFNCPVIAVMSIDALNSLHNHMGNPTHPILYPSPASTLVGKLDFMERLISVFFNFMVDAIFHYIKPQMQLIVNKHFGKSASDLDDLMERVNMVFINTDPILHPIRPLVPAVIQIGAGIHLKPPKPLPKDIQKFLDSASEGAIYFSLGSNAQSKDLTKNTLAVLTESLRKLPYKVLWKFEGHLAEKPDNVMITKWAPQQDILRHPNIKLFISQCGLQSTEEALHSGVPILGMPIFGDQPTNAKLIENIGIGLAVDHRTITDEDFSSKVMELILNPKYRVQVRKLSNLAKDQPMTGLQKAIWWTEYVLRHKGAKHLRGPAADIPAYQYYLLDVLGFCSLIIGVIVFIIVKTIRLVCKLKFLFKGTNKIKVT